MTDKETSRGPSHQELVDWLRLELIPGVGPVMRRKILDHFGTPAAALAAAQSQLREISGLGPKLAAQFVAADKIDVEAEIELCKQHGIEILTEPHAGYPRALREIPDPPGVLFVRGQLLPSDAISVAIVGTRHPTLYGSQMAERLAGELARRGICIVSGLARGVDAAAHRGALAAGGRTIAVLASGVLNIYPPEHDQLADQVAAQGALISESPPRSEPLSGMFPQRNRIISGLSHGTLVIEAAYRSGALITARHAMEQGREVFAMPGRVDSRMSHGCHRLIRDGATLVETADDILESLGPLIEATPRADGQITHHPAELLLNEIEQQVLAAMSSEPTAIDHLIAQCNLPVPQVLSILTVLEMRGLVRRLSGSTVVRV